MQKKGSKQRLNLCYIRIAGTRISQQVCYIYRVVLQNFTMLVVFSLTLKQSNLKTY